VSRMACIKHIEDSVLLSKREGSHNDSTVVSDKEVYESFRTQT
jgi:hypothetical protein